MADWSHYFHFPTGQAFDVDGPIGYDGTGKVIENLPNTLVVRLDLDRWGPAPALHATLTIEYVKEGRGNRVSVSMDGKPIDVDPDAIIKSNDEKRRRSISSTPFTGSVQIDGIDEIDLDIDFDGKSYDFDLLRKHAGAPS
ncbi:MAG: hypothetical protein U1F43_22165 [Myxococcota bacterium]